MRFSITTGDPPYVPALFDRLQASLPHPADDVDGAGAEDRAAFGQVHPHRVDRDAVRVDDVPRFATSSPETSVPLSGRTSTGGRSSMWKKYIPRGMGFES
jgi:hypothetical protein